MALDISAKEQFIMNKKIISDFPIGKLTRVKDFLPLPHELASSNKTVKVTIALSKPSVDFFKLQAKKNHTKYQRMIRQLIDQYVSHFSA